MKKFFNQFDDEPCGEEIIWKRSVRERWTSRVNSILNQEASKDRDWEQFAITLSSVRKVYDISLGELAKFPNPDPFVSLLREVTIRVLDRRELHFESDLLHAIANPDEEGENLAMLFGFALDGPFGYELNLPVTLNRDQDGRDFDLFFALVMAKVELLDLKHFLGYHLQHNFQGNPDLFRDYLLLLFMQYETILLDSGSPETVFERPVLTAKTQKGVGLWLDRLHPAIPASSLAVSVLKPSEMPGKIAIQQNQIEDVEVEMVKAVQFDSPGVGTVLFSILSPFFESHMHNDLRRALEGYDLPAPILFKSNSNRFVQVFHRCFEKGLVLSPKNEVRNWIVKNFRYISPKTKLAQSFDFENVYKSLCNQGLKVKSSLNLQALEMLGK